MCVCVCAVRAYTSVMLHGAASEQALSGVALHHDIPVKRPLRHMIMFTERGTVHHMCLSDVPLCACVTFEATESVLV